MSPRRLVRSVFAAGALLSLAVIGGLSFAAAEADATTFPGNNGRIAASGAFNTVSTGSKLELFSWNSGGGAECQSTDNEQSDFNPRYSKDGKKVAFVRDNNIWTMQLDSTGTAPDPGGCASPGAPYGVNQPGNQKQLTGVVAAAGVDSFVGGWCQYPSTHSDPNKANTEWVVFQRNTVALSFEVYRVRVGADRLPVPGTEQNLTLNAANDSQPSVTHDCAKIAFHSNRPSPVPAVPAPPPGSSLSNIWVMGFDGDAPTTNTDDPTVLTANRVRVNSVSDANGNKQLSEESAPSWKPNKMEIVFQTDSDTVPGKPRNMEIYSMPANGSSYTRLTDSPSNAEAGETGFDVTAFDLVPTYSPNGGNICFHTGRAMNRIDDGDPLTADPPDPAWRNSGAAGILGQWEIYKQSSSVLNGSVERVTTRKGNDERCGWQESP